MITIAKYSSTIEYNLKTTLDSSGITKLQQEITQLETQLTRLSSRKLISDSEFSSAQTQIKALKTAISKSYNSKLGLIDWTSFNSSFKTAKGNIQDLITTMNKGGVTGKNALTQTISTLGQLDTKLSSVSKATEKVFNTIGNTVRWGVVASGFQEVMNAAHDAVEYVKDLDTSLTNIMMVTDESRSSMNEYAKSANEAAKALGSTTVAMTDATTVFAQQGFNLDQSQQLATLSTKLANASQQDTSTTSDQITAYMNAYGMSDNMEELSKALDAWAEVANVSAADVEELATASQKAASTASTVGVNMDQLASQIATIESVTKDAPENIGNGLKTIYARFSDISMGETLDDGVSLGTVTGTLDKIGVQVLDEAGKMRDVGDIMEDLMGVWDTMDSTSKNSVATTLAGKYQLSRFEALMNSSDMYEEYKQSAQEGKDKGTLDVMNEKYTESLQGKLNKLQASAEGIINSLFNSSDFYGFIDGLSAALDLLGDFVDSLGDAQTIMLGIASIAGKAFKGQIANGISNIMTNVQRRDVTNKNQEAGDLALQIFNKNKDELTDEQKNVVDTVMDSRSLSKYMNEDQRAEQQQKNNAYIDSVKEYTAAQAAHNDKMEGLQAAYSIMGAGDAVKGSAKDGWDYSNLQEMFDEPSTRITQKDIEDYGIGEIARGFSNADSEAIRLYATLEKINSEEELNEDQIEDIVNKISQAKKALEGIDTTNGTINDEVEKMKNLINQIDTSIGLGKDGNNNAKKAGEELANKTKENQEKAEKATKVHGETLESIKKSEDDAAGAKSRMDSNRQQTKGGLENAQQTKKIQNALKILNGVSSLTFSVEALSNLKSVWDDDSLSGSEKLTQTLTNLAGTLPMAASGVSELYEGFSNLSKAGKIAAGSLGAIVAVVTLVSMAVSAYNDNIDAQISKEQELVTKQKEQSDSTSKTVASWKELYKTYQQTGQVTDEFRTSSEQIIQSLKLQGQEANIAAGNYTALASAIDKANQTELKNTISEAQKANSEGGSLYKSLTGGKLFDGGLVQDINSAAFSSLSLEERSEYGVEAWGGDTTDVTGMISFARSQVDNLNTQISNLGNSYDEYKKKAGDAAMTQAEWNTKTTQLNTTLTKFNDVLDSEDVQNWVENAKTAADATLQLSSFTSKISSQGKSLDSLYNIFSSTSGVSDYFNQLSGDDQWSYILDSGVLSDAQKQAVKYQQALTNLGRSAYFSNDNNDEKASSIVDTVQKRLTDKDDFIEFVGSMDVDATEENINNLVDQYLNNKITVSFVGSIDTTDLKTAQSSKSTFADLLDSYETAYQSKGGFTEDEAASLIAENSDYLQYLTKVGEVYQLNEKALDAWTEKTREQTDAMQELRGETADMSEQQSTINSILGNKTGESDWMNGLLTDMRELNYQFSNGDIDTSAFMDGLSDACDGLTNRVHALGDDWGKFVSDVNNANFASNFVDELYQGLTQANKQYKAGTITIGDYSTTVKKAAASAINLNMAQTKAKTVLKDGKLYYKNTGTEVKDLDDKTTGLTDDTKKLIKQYQNLDAATDFDNFVTDNFETMLQIFDDSGNVLDSVATSAGGISTEYEDTIQGLASTMAKFYSTNDDAATQVAAQISSVTGESLDQTTAMVKNADELSTEMMNNTGVASTAMQGTMTQTESAISDMASGISGIITAILSSISSLNGAGVEGTVETNDGESKDVEITTKDGDTTVLGTLHVPGFSMKLNSSGSSDSSKASELTSDGWTKGRVDTGNKDNGNSTGYWTQYTRQNEDGGTDETWIASSSDEIVSYSSNKLATGLQSLLGSSNASLKDYAPVGYGTNPSDYGNQYSDGDGDGSGGSGGSGDSGDSGSDDNYDDSTEEYLEDELDLYEKVNTELEKVEGHLDNISEDYDRLIGFNKTSNMEEQIADYQKLIALQEEKLNIEKQEAEDYRNRLSSYGITFDSEGVVQNYADIYNQLKNNYNALVDEYNASTDKAYKETLKTQMEEAQDAFDKYNDYIDRYDELIGDEIQSTENQIKEYYHEIEDLRIEALEDAYEEIETLQDLESVWNKLQGMWSGYKSDSPFRQMIVDQADLADYFNMTASAASKMFNTIIKKNRELAEQATTDEERDRYNAIADWHEQAQNDFSADNNTGIIGYYTKFLEYMNSDDAKNLYGSNEAQYIEDLQQAYEDTANAILDAEEKYEDIIDDVIDAYDDINDRLEDRIDDYEDIADQLDHTLNQIETLFGDEQYDKTIKIAQKQADVYTQATAEAEKQLEYWNTQLTQAIAQGLDDDIINDLKDKVQSAQETMNDLAESAAEAVRKVYDTETDKYLSDFEEKVYGAYKTTDSDGNTVTWDSDFLNMQWEQAQTNADQYLDTVERTYQVEKLRNKYQQMMNDTNDPAIQKQIANAMNEQLNYLNRIDEATGEKVKLSEYDLEYANAQLEVLQKRIALEEAQRNKSQMKLKRDSQGNYSYVYTANEDDTLSAQQELSDAEYNGYEISKDNYSSQMDNYMSALNTFVENARSIREKYAGDEATATAQIQALWDQTSEYLAGIAQQMGVSETGMLDSIKQLALDSVGEVSDSYNDIASSMEENMEDALQNIGVAVNTSCVSQIKDLESVDEAASQLQNDLTKSAEEYVDKAADIASAAKESYTDVTNAINDATKAQQELTAESTKFWNLVDEDTNVVNSQLSNLQSLKDALNDVKSQYSQTAQALKDALSQLEQKTAEASYWEGVANGTISRGGDSNSSGGSGGGTTATGYSADEDTAWGIAKAIWTYGDNGWGDDPTRHAYLTEGFGEDFANYVQDIINNYSESGALTDFSSDIYSYFRENVLGYDTGGYTGSWSDKTDDEKNGKLALLHQKELVLNATDTQNILSAVDIIRNMTDSLKAGGLSTSLNTVLQGLTDSTANMGNSVEQDVHITAEFPNASDASEIREALLSLNDRAYQKSSQASDYSGSTRSWYYGD